MPDDLTLPDLLPLAPTFAATRDALHQVAFFAVAPRRYHHAGRLGLRAVPGGFGTPPYDTTDGRERVLVLGERLVVERNGTVVADTRPATVVDACATVGVPYRETWFDDFHDPLAPQDPTAALDHDPDAAHRLADWFAFGTLALQRLREDPAATGSDEVQLWPEHFDPATSAGDGDAGRRASFGASPGDGDHDEPYLFVAPWAEPDPDEFWNDATFGGASLSYTALRGTDQPVDTAVAFLRQGLHLLDPTT